MRELHGVLPHNRACRQPIKPQQQPKIGCFCYWYNTRNVFFPHLFIYSYTFCLLSSRSASFSVFFLSLVLIFSHFNVLRNEEKGEKNSVPRCIKLQVLILTQATTRIRSTHMQHTNCTDTKRSFNYYYRAFHNCLPSLFSMSATFGNTLSAAKLKYIVK